MTKKDKIKTIFILFFVASFFLFFGHIAYITAGESKHHFKSANNCGQQCEKKHHDRKKKFDDHGKKGVAILNKNQFQTFSESQANISITAEMPAVDFPAMVVEQENKIWNRLSEETLLSFFPNVFTWTMAETWQRKFIELNGEKQFFKLQKEVTKRFNIWENHTKSAECEILIEFPQGEKDKEWHSFGIITFKAEDTNITNIELFILSIVESIRLGANAIVLSGEGAQLILEGISKTLGLSISSGFAPSGYFGGGLSFGFSRSKGSSRYENKPFITITLLRVDFEAGSRLDQVEKRIQNVRLELNECRFLGYNNLKLRLAQTINLIESAFLIKNSREKNFRWGEAKDNLVLAEKNLQAAKKEGLAKKEDLEKLGEIMHSLFYLVLNELGYSEDAEKHIARGGKKIHLDQRE